MNDANHPIPQEKEMDLGELLKVRREKLLKLQQDGKNPYDITSFNIDAYSKPINDSFEQFEGQTVHIAGRIMSKRDMGKASFIDIQDTTGRIQSYVRKDHVGEDSYSDFKKLDIGDIVGVVGEVFRTQKGQISIKASSVTLLSKSLIPLPEKFHGLKDLDLRYRQRYVDLIVNPDVKESFVKRSIILKQIRLYLDNLNFLEVETPVLQTVAGGAAARPFNTHHNSLGLDMHLRISLELYLKRLIVGGFDKVYEIGRVFRNEGMSVRHNPEFTLLELYQAYTDFIGMMELTEDLIRNVAKNTINILQIPYGEHIIDIERQFERLTMIDSIIKFSDVDFTNISSIEEARTIAKKHNIEFEERHGIGDIINLFFERYVEENLIQPTFITDYPVEISPLAKRKSNNPQFTERFELFILGREYANAFSELNDPIDQRERFMQQVSMKNAGDLEASDMDEDFLNALEYAMPPTGGLGIGIDRLIMLLTNASSIRDVLLFPTMKPEAK